MSLTNIETLDTSCSESKLEEPILEKSDAGPPEVTESEAESEAESEEAEAETNENAEESGTETLEKGKKIKDPNIVASIVEADYSHFSDSISAKEMAEAIKYRESLLTMGKNHSWKKGGGSDKSLRMQRYSQNLKDAKTRMQKAKEDYAYGRAQSRIKRAATIADKKATFPDGKIVKKSVSSKFHANLIARIDAALKEAQSSEDSKEKAETLQKYKEAIMFVSCNDDTLSSAQKQEVADADMN